MSDPIKLNIGAGDVEIPGYTPIDIRAGQAAYPLEYPDESVDEIRASHILEHFGHRETAAVIADWVRVLKVGGRLRIAVPDFDYIVNAYGGGSAEPLEGYLMGGHSDANDRHGAIFNRDKLMQLMRAAGLVALRSWADDVGDCASLPVSLNLEGRKAGPAMFEALKDFRVVAAMSVPRLGFMANFFCAFQGLRPNRIPIRKHEGAFWGQCLERCMGEILEQDAPDAILTLDYDTIFTAEDVWELKRLMIEHPEADAIAALQSARTRPLPLMTIRDTDGRTVRQVRRELMDAELLRVSTAHFGLTLIRADKLAALPHPWFKGEPDAEGHWSDQRTDADIWFWRQWEAAGNTLYSANRVPIGHAELMIRWPGRDLRAIYQHPWEFYEDGRPEGSWQ